MRNNAICVAKTKERISFAATARLICAFVFAYAKSGFITTRLINTLERADSNLLYIKAISGGASNMILVFDTKKKKKKKKKNCVAYVLSSCNMKTACVKAPFFFFFFFFFFCRVSQTRFFKLYGCYLLPFTSQLRTKIVFTIKEMPAYIVFHSI